MIIKVNFSQKNFDEAVKFISENNRYFEGNDLQIKRSMQDGIESLVSQFPNCSYYATMGFTILVVNLQIQSPQEMENSIDIEFLVEPNLGIDGQLDWTSENYLQR